MDWIDKLDGNVIVSDKDGVIIYMNEKASLQYHKAGDENILGKNLKDCHSERSMQKIQEIESSGGNNVYSIEKKGIKKLIYQSPWYNNGEFQGIVELSLEIPFDMPHFLRD
jgi:transcriptional regulator with PAS, ATPase and Fis domain